MLPHRVVVRIAMLFDLVALVLLFLVFFRRVDWAYALVPACLFAAGHVVRGADEMFYIVMRDLMLLRAPKPKPVSYRFVDGEPVEGA
jgi:hypothetical protein